MEIIGEDLSGVCLVGHCHNCGAIIQAGFGEVDSLNDGWGSIVGHKADCPQCCEIVYFQTTTEDEIAKRYN